MTFVDERNAAYFWNLLSPTQRLTLLGAAADGGVLPFAGYTIATVRVLRRQGYLDGTRLSEDGVALVRHVPVKAVTA